MNIGGRSLIARLMRSWMLLLIVAVVALAGSVVYRVHGLFGSDNEITRPGTGLVDDAEPFDPKLVTYEVFGTVGAVATINYLDLQAVPQKVANVPLPWSITLTTPSASASATVVAQGDGNTIGCRVVVNDEVKAEHSSDGVNAQTFCLVKSA